MIAAVMVTTAARQWAIPLAVEAFESQYFHGKGDLRLFVVSDGESIPVVPEASLGSRVRHLHLSCWSGSLGEKRNIAVSTAVAFGADTIVCWDDDDFHHPERVSMLVHALASGSRVAGSASLVFADLRSDEKWLYRYLGSRPYLVGGSMAFYASDWRAVGGYPHIDQAEDTKFAHRICRLDRERVMDFGALAMYSLYVPTRHGANTGRITMREPKWTRWKGDLGSEVNTGLERLRIARAAALSS